MSNPPPYTNDISPPPYTSTPHPSQETQCYWLSHRLPTHTAHDPEIIPPGAGHSRDEPEARMINTQYEYTDTGRGPYTLPLSPSSSLSSLASDAESDSGSIRTTIAAAQRTDTPDIHQHDHTWPSPPPYSPPRYETLQLRAASAEAGIGARPSAVVLAPAAPSVEGRDESALLRNYSGPATADASVSSIARSSASTSGTEIPPSPPEMAPVLVAVSAPAHPEPHGPTAWQLGGQWIVVVAVLGIGWVVIAVGLRRSRAD